MAFRDLMPGPDEARGVAIGFILSFFLHPIAVIAVALIGTAIEPASGGLIALPFLAFIGVTQWLYVLPVFWLLRRRGRRALAKGVLIGGALVFLASSLCYGGLAFLSMQEVATVRSVQQNERDHLREYASTDGIVMLGDDTHFDAVRSGLDGAKTTPQIMRGAGRPAVRIRLLQELTHPRRQRRGEQPGFDQ